MLFGLFILCLNINSNHKLNNLFNHIERIQQLSKCIYAKLPLLNYIHSACKSDGRNRYSNVIAKFIFEVKIVED